jgi:hypothetical protein
MANKPNYGIDAPNVIRNFFIAGAVFLIVDLAFPRVTIAHIEFVLNPGFLWPALWFILFGGLMLLYSLVGKYRHRDRMLAKLAWSGAENVLDVGTGRGLLSTSPPGMPRASTFGTPKICPATARRR